MNGKLKKKFKNTKLKISVTTDVNLDNLDMDSEECFTELILNPTDYQSNPTEHIKRANMNKANSKRKLDDEEANEDDDDAESVSSASTTESSKPSTGRLLKSTTSNKNNKKLKGKQTKSTTAATTKKKDDLVEIDEEKVEEEEEEYKGEIQIFLNSYEGDSSEQKIRLIRLLNEVNPRYIILYDSELWFVRRLELYKLLNFSQQIRIYFLMYKNSYEEQKYLTSVRSEKEAFEILIKEKAVRFQF